MGFPSCLSSTILVPVPLACPCHALRVHLAHPRLVLHLQLSLSSTFPDDPTDWIPLTELSFLSDSTRCGVSLDHPHKHPLKPKGQSVLVTPSHTDPGGPLARVGPHSNGW